MPAPHAKRAASLRGGQGCLRLATVLPLLVCLAVSAELPGVPLLRLRGAGGAGKPRSSPWDPGEPGIRGETAGPAALGGLEAEAYDAEFPSLGAAMAAGGYDEVSDSASCSEDELGQVDGSGSDGEEEEEECLEEGEGSEEPDDGLVENKWRFLQCEGEGLWAGRRYSVLRHTRLGTAIEMWEGSEDFAFNFLTSDGSEVRAFLPSSAGLAFVGRLSAPSGIEAARSASSSQPLRASDTDGERLRSMGSWAIEARGEDQEMLVLVHTRSPGVELALLPDGFLLLGGSVQQAVAVEGGRIGRLCGAAAPELLERKTRDGERLLPFADEAIPAAGGGGRGEVAEVDSEFDDEGGGLGDLLGAGRGGIRGFDGELEPFDAVMDEEMTKGREREWAADEEEDERRARLRFHDPSAVLSAAVIAEERAREAGHRWEDGSEAEARDGSEGSELGSDVKGGGDGAGGELGELDQYGNEEKYGDFFEPLDGDEFRHPAKKLTKCPPPPPRTTEHHMIPHARKVIDSAAPHRRQQIDTKTCRTRDTMILLVHHLALFQVVAPKPAPMNPEPEPLQVRDSRTPSSQPEP